VSVALSPRLTKVAVAAGSATSHFSVTAAGKRILGWVVVRFGVVRRPVVEIADRCRLAAAAVLGMPVD